MMRRSNGLFGSRIYEKLKKVLNWADRSGQMSPNGKRQRAASLLRMTYVEPTEDLPPVAGANIVYLGPVAPHWDIRHTFGEQKMIDAFRVRVNARLLLLPKHDPQFRRNRERVNRDAERELIRLEWDLGDEEAARYAAPNRETAPVVAEAPVEEVVVEDVAAVEAPAEDEMTEATAVVEATVENAIAEETAVETVAADEETAVE